jgi:uncharacterized protein YoaH (UPF0181 family)
MDFKQQALEYLLTLVVIALAGMAAMTWAGLSVGDAIRILAQPIARSQRVGN